jgi:hypothetical protein
MDHAAKEWKRFQKLLADGTHLPTVGNFNEIKVVTAALKLPRETREQNGDRPCAVAS